MGIREAASALRAQGHFHEPTSSSPLPQFSQAYTGTPGPRQSAQLHLSHWHLSDLALLLVIQLFKMADARIKVVQSTWGDAAAPRYSLLISRCLPGYYDMGNACRVGSLHLDMFQAA